MPHKKIKKVITKINGACSSALPSQINALIKAFQEKAFCLKEDVLARPIYGTTLYLATCSVDMRMGAFKAYIFQDIIHKGYVIALTYGNVESADTLYVRLHSSCVTSETLRGCDCDCVQQLESALKLIVEKGSGILFYLMQEGRGIGYVAKARDRMLVQTTNDQISTFDAYEMLGLQRDYRQYRNIKDICFFLNIKASFVLLTNNPDKVQAMQRQNIHIAATETLEIEPSPYNLAYLTSKMEYGHILEKPLDATTKRIALPEPVIPFAPYALEEAQRFVYAASYMLPVRPIEGEVVLSLREEELRQYFEGAPIDSYIEREEPLIVGYRMIRNNRIMVTIHERNMTTFQRRHPESPLAKLLTTPYWFRVHVYFDTITGEDFVVLTYGDLKTDESPVVRLHSESIFNRFPVKDMDNREKFKSTIKEIVQYGVGLIVMLYNDGRGAGFGAYAQDKMLTELGLSKDTNESYQKLGVSYDRRDYDAAVMLLKHHIQGNKVQMVMNSPASLIKKKEYSEALNKYNIDVEEWIFLEQHKRGKQ